MNIKEMAELVRSNGVVGAGGAGFPTYAKLDERAETIIMNCAECEPLLKLHRQLLTIHAREIIKAFHMIAKTVNAKEAVIGIKKEYKEAILAIEQYIGEFPNMRIHLLDNVYPMGDEVVLIYEVTGRVVRPGGLPIEEGIAVFNVETTYNVYKACEEQLPVVDKLVSIVGEVEHPVTVRVPIGTSLEKTVALAGNVTVTDAVYFVGGPMMGNIKSKFEPVTKTTNAIIVLPKGHLLVQKKNRSASIDMKRAASACCQCQMCTDLCPRHALGHPIEPHKFMRSSANKDFQNTNVFLNTMFCSSCGLCEMFSCPQGLSPRTLITEYKDGLKKARVAPPKDVKAANIKESREYRKAPEERLQARLGLSKYDKEAPLNDQTASVEMVKILTSQHIGAPAKPIVADGDVVKKGQLIASAADGLSVAIHASIEGKVIEVTDSYIMIQM